MENRKKQNCGRATIVRSCAVEDGKPRLRLCNLAYRDRQIRVSFSLSLREQSEKEEKMRI
jgi:hypothetical protein